MKQWLIAAQWHAEQTLSGAVAVKTVRAGDAHRLAHSVGDAADQAVGGDQGQAATSLAEKLKSTFGRIRAL